jgi:hypothetical protein
MIWGFTLRTKLLSFILICTLGLYAENYIRVYNPTASVDSISLTDLFTEYDEISRLLKGFLEGSNIEDGSLLSADIKDDVLETGKIKDGTLIAADYANITTIAKGSLLYSSALSTFGEIAVGANSKALYTDGTRLTYETMPALPWTDTGSIIFGATDDNVAIGGSAVGTSGKSVLALYNNTVPSTSVTNGVQMYAEDVSDTNMKLLLHLDGADASTTFTDSSYRTQTVSGVGTAQIDTAQSKFGGASLVLEGTASYLLNQTNESDFDFGSNAFTIEMFIRINSLPSSGSSTTFVSKKTDNNNNYVWFISNSGGTYTFAFQVYSASSALVNATGPVTPSINNWYHIAVSRSGTSWETYFNGTRIANLTDVDNIPDYTGNLIIGRNPSASSYFNGWIDEVRIKNGERMYTGATITPPTAAFQDGVVSELKVRDEAGNITTKSPHNMKLIPTDRLKKYYFPFNYYSYNEEIGYEVSVDMYGFLREVEKLTGKKMIFKKGVKADEQED